MLPTMRSRLSSTATALSTPVTPLSKRSRFAGGSRSPSLAAVRMSSARVVPVGVGLEILGSPLRRSSGSSGSPATTDTADGARLSSESSSQYASSSSGGRASSYFGGAQMPFSEGSAEGNRALRGEILNLRELQAKNVDDNLNLREQLRELQAKNVESTKQTGEQIAALKERQQQLRGTKEQIAALNTENVQLKEEQQQFHGAAQLRELDYKEQVEKMEASTKAATLMEEKLKQANDQPQRWQGDYATVIRQDVDREFNEKYQERFQTSAQEKERMEKEMAEMKALQEKLQAENARLVKMMAEKEVVQVRAVQMEKEKAADVLQKEKDGLMQKHEKEMDATKKEIDATKKVDKQVMTALREENKTLRSGQDTAEMKKARNEEVETLRAELWASAEKEKAAMNAWMNEELERKKEALDAQWLNELDKRDADNKGLKTELEKLKLELVKERASVPMLPESTTAKNVLAQRP